MFTPTPRSFVVSHSRKRELLGYLCQERVKAQAQAEIEQELNGIKDALRAQLGGLAVSGAEKILGATIDQNAHAELVSKLAAEI